MNWNQKFLHWFSSRPRWQQVVLIILFSLLVVIGFWFSDYSSSDTSLSMVDSTAWILGAILKFGLVLLLIYGAAIIFRRWQSGSIKNNTRRMKILETTSLSPRRAIHLVQIDGQTFVVGATDQNVSLIAELEPVDNTDHDLSIDFANSYAIAETKLDDLQGKLDELV